MENPIHNQPPVDNPGRLRRLLAVVTLASVATIGIASEAFAADDSPNFGATTSAQPLEAASVLAADPTETASPTAAPSPTETPSPSESPTSTPVTPSPVPALTTAPAPSPAATEAVAPSKAPHASAEIAPIAQELTVATWNILGDSHQAAGRAVGGNVVDRVKRESLALRKQNPDIFGLQEVTSQSQRKNIESHLSDLYSFVGSAQNQNPIAFKKDRFDFIESRTFRYPYYDSRTPAGRDGVGTIVLLRDKHTGKRIFVLNDHAPAHEDHPNAKSDRGAAMKRLKLAEIERAIVLREMEHHPDDIVFNIGDKNATNNLRNKTDRLTPIAKDPALYGKRNALEVCVATAPIKLDGKRFYPLQDAIDMANGKDPGHCQDKKHNYQRDWTVDWIFTSPATFDVIKARFNAIKRTSDHQFYMVTGREQPQQFASKDMALQKVIDSALHVQVPRGKSAHHARLAVVALQQNRQAQSKP